MSKFVNPFKPGAGHAPPYLAGRETEKDEFLKLLRQDIVLSNFIITGLRGVGKTVLLDELKPLAISEKWLWVGTDLSESTSVSEDAIICRLITDLAIVANGLVIKEKITTAGFSSESEFIEKPLNYQMLMALYQKIPGLPSDKLKFILEYVYNGLNCLNFKGVIFAYDEAQTMSDHEKEKQFPLSLLLDVFQSIQRKGIPFMLVMVGLPTLFPKLVETRTYAERMFNLQVLGRLNDHDCEAAITKPIQKADAAIQFTPDTVKLIISTSGGYPYFIQYICKEIFDIVLQQYTSRGAIAQVAMEEIIKKLDKDFFSGRWAKATDRQRDLMNIIASMDNCDEEFSVQEIVASSKKQANPFSPSHVNQMLSKLSDVGLIYKNRYGKYAFAVPLLGGFIRRQEAEAREAKQMNLSF